jgi:hypothetical protein
MWTGILFKRELLNLELTYRVGGLVYIKVVDFGLKEKRTVDTIQVSSISTKPSFYLGGDSSLSLSDAGSPATPQCDLGISCTTTSTACLGIPKSTKTLVIPWITVLAFFCPKPSQTFT